MESFSILLSLCFCLCTISLKGQLTQKFKFFHQLSALMSFQTRKTLVLLRNTIEDIWMKPGRFLYSENTFTSAEISHARSLKNQHACVSCWRERPLSRYSGTRKRRAMRLFPSDLIFFFGPLSHQHSRERASEIYAEAKIFCEWRVRTQNIRIAS